MGLYVIVLIGATAPYVAYSDIQVGLGNDRKDQGLDCTRPDYTGLGPDSDNSLQLPHCKRAAGTKIHYIIYSFGCTECEKMKNMSSLVEGKILEFLLTLRTNEGLLYGLESRGCRQRAFVLTKNPLGEQRAFRQLQ